MQSRQKGGSLAVITEEAPAADDYKTVRVAWSGPDSKGDEHREYTCYITSGGVLLRSETRAPDEQDQIICNQVLAIVLPEG